MKTKRYKVDTFLHRLFCPVCDTEMVDTKATVSTNPPQFLFACPKKGCEQQQFTTKVYPSVEYVIPKPIEKKEFDENLCKTEDPDADTSS